MYALYVCLIFMPYMLTYVILVTRIEEMEKRLHKKLADHRHTLLEDLDASLLGARSSCV